MLPASGLCVSARSAPSRLARHCTVVRAATTTTPANPQGSAAAKPARPDLEPAYVATKLSFQNPVNVPLTVPVFSNPNNGPTRYETVMQTAQKLDKATIQQIKAAAAARLSPDVQQRIAQIKADASRNANAGSGFSHPGGITSAAELAVMQARLAKGLQPQTKAKECLISGEGVPKKNFGSWAPPTDCKPSTYDGPYAMADIFTMYGGADGKRDGKPVVPAPNYPWEAPRANSGHVSFVELDAPMAYKMALAWWATGDESYAQKALAIIDAWASTNKSWGYLNQNGPLEAGWGVAAMARALELLRHKAPSGMIPKFLTWIYQKDGPMAQMDWYVDVSTPNALSKGDAHLYGNWHSTIIEAWMAVAVLSDDTSRYYKARNLFNTTVQDYLWKWGRDPGNKATFDNRLIGETSETLRDIYHSQFGLGGLIQAAEIAWQSLDDDLFSSNNHALVAAMELHARIIRAGLAGSNVNMLPPGFKFYTDDWFKRTLPNNNPPPAGTKWQFEMKVQKWVRLDVKTYQYLETWDKEKIVSGISFLPCGWEVGYNHFAGRLGLKMPETAALLKTGWPEWQSFHWGLGSLSHADTAAALWRAGLPGSKVAPS